MWYRRDEQGVVVGGPYNCDQSFPVEWLPDDHPGVLAMLARAVPTPQPTLVDVIAVLTSEQRAQIEARVAAKDVPFGISPFGTPPFPSL